MTRHILKKHGFTFIELMVVIGIIAILATIVLLNTGNARSRANDVARIKQLNDLHGALALYYLDHKKYPSMDPVCEQINEDNDAGTNSKDDNPVCYSSALKPATDWSGAVPVKCLGAPFPKSDCATKVPGSQPFEDATDPSIYYGCSGDGTTDTKSCGWGVNRAMYPYQIHNVQPGGICPSASNTFAPTPTGTRLHRLGYDYQTTASDPTYPVNYPSGAIFIDENYAFQNSYGGDFLDTGSTFMEKLFNEGYLSRKDWGLSTAGGDYNSACRYVILGTENLDDGNGQPPWEGNVQSYILFCPLEKLTDKAKNDGGFDDNVYEIYSPGTPKICVRSEI